MASLFGFQLRRAKDKNPPESFAPPLQDDGAAVVVSSAMGGAYGTYIDLEGSVRGEAELITKYRQMSLDPKLDPAIDEVVNEAIVVQDDEPIVKIDLEDIKGLPPNIKQLIHFEFEEVLRLLEFNTQAYHIFKQWYVDGRIYYHIIIDREAMQEGIRELRYVDPRKIKKIREVTRKPAEGQKQLAAVTVQQTKAEYYVYNEAGFDSKVANPGTVTGSVDAGLKIAKDAIVYVTSGLLNETGAMVLSHLHSAIRPLNMLRTMEDSAVIYRLVRAPSRRVWYIDVGNLPKHKAEQVVYDMMVRHRNKLVYDPATGAIRDQRKHTTMLEDIWLSRREGSKGTQVEELPAGQNLGQMEEVQYFLKELYKSLHVPLGRLDPELLYSIGRATEITRDEIKFAKFIGRLRARFSELFLDILEKQLVLKGILLPEDWDQLRPLVRFEFTRDNYFSELKDAEVFNLRFMTATAAMPFIGRFVSNAWVRQHVLHQNGDEMEEMDEEMMMEREDPLYMAQMGPDGMPMPLEPGMSAPPEPPKPPRKKKSSSSKSPTKQTAAKKAEITVHVKGS